MGSIVLFIGKIGDNMKQPKIFLGGTCNNSTWRSELIELLNIDYFNPVVDDWTPECMSEEIRQRESCDYVLYVITPQMTGVYSIAEVVDDSNKQPEKTILCVLPDYNGESFSNAQLKSLESVGRMVHNNGGKYVYDNLIGVARLINNHK